MERFATPRDSAFALPAKDQALLEFRRSKHRLPKSSRLARFAVKTGDLSDPANGFLSAAAAFLTGRPDRDALIERLREAVVNAAKPPPDAAKAPTGQPPEGDDVRSDV